MSGTISVLIPAYNAESTLAITLQSVFSQTAPADEIIVVDDGSSDGTARVAKSFGDHIQFIQQDNQGAAIARQTGTDAASSDYIAYIDADDWWLEDRLAICREILGRQEIHFLFADLQRAVPGANEEEYLPRNTTFYPWAEDYFDGNSLVPDVPDLYRLDIESGLSLILRGFPVYPSTMLVRRSSVGAVGGWDGRFRRSQDFDIALRLARKYPLHFHKRVSAILGLHEVNSDEKAYVIKQTRGDIAVLEQHIASNSDRRYVRDASGALSRKYCGLGYTYREMNDRENANVCYRKAMGLPGRRMHAFTRYIATLKK